MTPKLPLIAATLACFAGCALLLSVGCALSARSAGMQDPTVEAIRALAAVIQAQKLPTPPPAATPTPTPAPTPRVCLDPTDPAVAVPCPTPTPEVER